jgi:hypothetical protein
MNREKTRFWITCPHCKKSFGVSPDLVLKFIDRLDRLLDELTQRIERSESKIQQKERGA